MYELRKRLTGYFVLLHTESRQRHHKKNHMSHIDKKHHQKGGHKKSKRSVHDIAIETESRK